MGRRSFYLLFQNLCLWVSVFFCCFRLNNISQSRIIKQNSMVGRCTKGGSRMNGATTWFLLFAVLMVLEIITMNLWSLWFAGGAIAAALAACLKAPFPVQLLVFAGVSLVFLFFVRPTAVKYFNKKRAQASAEKMIGRQAIVISEINNRQGIGQVTVGEKEWSARSRNEEETLPIGSVVIVRDVKGMRLIVEEKKMI